MKNLFVGTGILAMAFAFSACGDSSSSASTDREDVPESSSVEESSSSVEEVSSSSENSNLPKGSREATLEDLGKNMYFDGLLKSKVYLATGSKHDLFSLWVPDSAWIGVRSEFENGTLVIAKSNAVASVIPGEGVMQSMEKLVEDSTVISFIVNSENKLQYTVDGKEFNDVVDTTVKTQSSVLSSGDSLSGKRLVCDETDSVFIYTFYDGRYIHEKVSGKDTVSWSAGYYDIQRSKLLMIPTFYIDPVPSMRTATISKEDYTLSFTTGVKAECDVEKFKFETVPFDLMAREWAATKQSVDWELKLGTDGNFELVGMEGIDNVELKRGMWNVFGDQLLMLNTGCLDRKKCSKAMKGTVSDFSVKKGFTYNHSNTDSPSIPTKWTVPEYE